MSTVVGKKCNQLHVVATYYYTVIMYFCIEDKDRVPLVFKALDLLHVKTPGAFQQEDLQSILANLLRIPLFKKASKKGVRVGLQYLVIVQKQFVKECKENKEVMKAITSICTKAVARDVMLKRAVTYVVTKGVAEVGLKACTAINGAGVVFDGAEAILEHCGHEQLGKKVGLFGNVATGACAGLLIGGSIAVAPIAVPLGMAAGLGLWLTGRSVTKGLDIMLSD